MRRLFACLLILTMNAYAVDPSHTESLRGYTAAHSAAEVQWEQKFRAIPEPDRLRENMRRLSARPHHVGSPYDKDNAEWLARPAEVLGPRRQDRAVRSPLPNAKIPKLELLGPTKFTAKLEEPILAVDPTSNQKE